MLVAAEASVNMSTDPRCTEAWRQCRQAAPAAERGPELKQSFFGAASNQAGQRLRRLRLGRPQLTRMRNLSPRDWATPRMRLRSQQQPSAH